MWRLAMIPKINRCVEHVPICYKQTFEKKVWYEVVSKYGTDYVTTLGMAIRYWLWHCGVPAKIAFFGIKKS